MKKLLAILLVAMMLLGLASTAMAEEKTEVTIWYYWETIKHQETLSVVIADYNASQDKVEVKTQYVPFADFKKQLSIGATADVLPDIVIIDGPDHASYAAMGIFADLTDKLADWEDLAQYFEGPIDSCTLDGCLYGIPFGSNCLALFYNEDMLAAAGQEVPTNWDELKAVAKATTKDNVSGLGFCSLQNEEGTFNFMPWVWSTGATSFEINSENTIKALTLIQDLVADGSLPKEAINWTQGDTMNQFISGNLAMMINGPWQVPTMREQAPDLNWNVALIPVDTVNASALGGENFAVIAGGEEDAALDFLKYATSAEKVTSYIDEFGYIAARKDVAAGQFQDDPTMQVFSAQMAYALPRGPHPDWPSISDAISLAFNQVIVGTMAPADAAAEAQSTIDAILAE
ncbi:MAG: ABC transporter substrate-binding protein [Clostridiales bacterium]|nr:ABC transporter substrate-binding protein [Clostridiales bacterium]